jgi:hypothetical protein
MHLIGAEIVALAPGPCTVALPYRPELAQQDGFFHAGMVTTIIDTACGYAAFTLMRAAARVLTVELKLNLMAPARGASGFLPPGGWNGPVERSRLSAARWKPLRAAGPPPWRRCRER